MSKYTEDDLRVDLENKNMNSVGKPKLIMKISQLV
jgi:hypothetical protein